MLEIIDKVLARSEGFSSEKERTFLGSIRQQFIQRGSLTPGQHGWLSSLEKKFSEENIKVENQWESQWTNDHRFQAIRVARYYERNPPYFSGAVLAILSNPEDFVLSKKQWDKFCENKYAKRIRNEYDTELKFGQGDCIQIRRTNKIAQANYTGEYYSRTTAGKEADRVGFILKADAKPVTRAAKGSRVYQILLAGDSSPIFAHESDLKKARVKR